MRKLKYSEKKLLKKTDFLNWKVDNTLLEANIMKKFFIQKREDYTFYNKMSRQIRTIAKEIKELDPKDPHRVEMGGKFLSKLYAVGLIPTKWNLEQCDAVNASSFCRLRLPCRMVNSGMVQRLSQAVTYVEQGHVRVGTNIVKDPAFLVDRATSDFITWVDTSKIRKNIIEYSGERDDYELDNC